MSQDLEIRPVTAVLDEIATIRFRPDEVEVIGRLLLGDLPVKLAPGTWWAYAPESGRIEYPAHLLGEWSGARVLGALCHEVAEAMFTGPAAAAVMREFGERAERLGLSAASALLLLNIVNDLRVNERYLAIRPGSAPFLRAVYREGLTLGPRVDLRRPGGGDRPLPHHQLLDAILRRWARRRWPEIATPAVDGPVAACLRRLAPIIDQALLAPDYRACAALVADHCLAPYAELVALSQTEISRAAEVAPLDEPVPESPTVEDGDEPAEPDQPERPAEAPDQPVRTVEVVVPRSLGEEAGPADAGQAEPPREGPLTPTPRPASPRGEAPPPLPTPQRGLGRSAIILRRFRPTRWRQGVDYENFDYIAAVRRLEPLIEAALYGRDGKKGLVEILNQRRFGTSDPWRRPRRHRRGDSGEIDEDRPENLLIDPALAFLKGTRQRRDDSLKDFANAILLDVSGSVVQRGYPSRKFDQLVDTTVLFIEIHERLKLPYQVMCFSEETRVLRSFAECAYDSMHIAPASAYVIKDFSYLIREMYHLEHGETHDGPALQRAVQDVLAQRGLKTILIVTDGISSDRAALVDMLVAIDERNSVVPPHERLSVLAFGVGLAEAEFKASYEPVVNGAPVACARGHLVPDIEALPGIICQALEERIRAEGRAAA